MFIQLDSGNSNCKMNSNHPPDLMECSNPGAANLRQLSRQLYQFRKSRLGCQFYASKPCRWIPLLCIPSYCPTSTCRLAAKVTRDKGQSYQLIFIFVRSGVCLFQKEVELLFG